MYNILKYIGRINLIPFAIKDKIIRKICPVGTEYEFTELFYGYKYVGNLNNYIDWSLFFYGCYEKSLLDFLKKIFLFYPNGIVLDIGANVGHHSLFFSRFNTTYSFEPHPKYFNLLENKKKINKLNNLNIFNFGLSDNTLELDFFEPNNENWGTGSFIEGYNEGLKKSPMKLFVLRADEVINNLNLPFINLIKIDVEGFEFNLIQGLFKIIEHYNPIVIMEYSFYTQTKFKTLENLKKCFGVNYKIYELRLNYFSKEKLVEIIKNPGHNIELFFFHKEKHFEFIKKYI